MIPQHVATVIDRDGDRISVGRVRPGQRSDNKTAVSVQVADVYEALSVHLDRAEVEQLIEALIEAKKGME